MKAHLTFLQQAIGVLLLSISLDLSPAWAQMKVGQPAGSPDPSAALDVSGGPYQNGSQYRGFAPPKVALIKTSLSSPVDRPVSGLLIYNTATIGDVTPGYYYWEGSKWLRFTTASAGSARVAVGNGQSVPVYSMSQVASLTTPPDIIYIADQRREGMFRYQQSSATVTDDGAMVLGTTGGFYKRVYTGAIEVEWFGAVGDGVINSTLTADLATNRDRAIRNYRAIQAACNYAANSSGTSSDDTHLPTNKERPAIVHIPSGTYPTSQTIELKGAINIQGDGGMSFGGTVVLGYQEPTNNIQAHHIFSIKSSNVGAASELHNMRLLLQSEDTSTTYAMIYIGDDDTRYNSIYVYNVWFQNSSNNTVDIWAKRSDDLKVDGCTFDGSANTLAVILGDATNDYRVTKCAITNNTIFDVRGGFCLVRNVEGLVFSGNRVYSVPEFPEIPYVFDMVAEAVRADGVMINDNYFSKCRTIVRSKFPVQAIGNTIANATYRLFEFYGAISNIQVVKNKLSGHWSTSEDAPFYATGETVLQNSEFDNTIVDNQGTSNIAYNIPNQGTLPNSIYTRQVIGFTNVTNAPANSVINPRVPFITGGNISGVTLTASNLTNINTETVTSLTATNASVGILNVNTGGNINGVSITNSTGTFSNLTVTAGTYNGGYLNGVTMNGSVITNGVSASVTSVTATNLTVKENLTLGGFIQPIFSNSIAASVTTNWTANAYNEILPENTLLSGHTYKLQIRIEKTGTDQSTSTYDLPMEYGWTNYGTHPDLVGVTNYYASPSRGIKVRLKTVASASGNRTPGLEMTLSDTTMQGCSVTVKVIPLI